MRNRMVYFKAALASVSFLLNGTVSQASNGTWNGTQNAYWTNSANWSASYPATNQTATFNGAGGSKTTIDLTGLSSISNITFDTASVAAYTIGSNGVNSQTLVMNNNGTYQMTGSAVNGQLFNAALQLGADAAGSTYNVCNSNTVRTLTFAGNVYAVTNGSAGTKTLNVVGTGNTTFSGSIQTNGVGAFIINDNSSGTLTLSGSNIITTLYMYGGPNSLVDIGSGTIFLNNGGGTTLYSTLGGTINGTGKIRMSTQDTITSNSNNYADCYIGAGRTLVINPEITGLGGFEMWSGTGTFVFNGINTFEAHVILGSTGGTLSVSKIGNRGSTTSNLGKGTNFIFSAANTKLLYTGIGETSNRQLIFNNTAIIDQSGASGNLNFSVSPTLSSGAKTVTLQGSSAGTGEFSAALVNSAGTLSITKEGTGTWAFTTNNTYTGATTVNNGTLALSGAYGAILSTSGITVTNGATLLLYNTAAANNGDRLKNAGTVTLNGGTLRFSNNGGAASYSETAGGLTVNLTANTIDASQAAAGQTSTLTFTSLSHAAGSTINFTGTGLGVDTRNRILITGQANGLIGPWARVNGTSYAAYDSTLGVYAAGDAAFTDIAARADSTIVSNDTSNVRINMDGTHDGPIELSSGTTRITSLLQNTAIPATVNTASKTLQTSGVTINENMANLTIGASVGDGSLAAAAAGGELALANNSDSTLTVNSAIVNNSSASSLTKYGNGTIVLKGSNTFSGVTSIGSGSLILANSDALRNSTLGTGGAVFDSSVSSHIFTLGSLGGSVPTLLADNAATPNPVALVVGNNNNNTTYSGVLGGSGSLSKIGSGTLTLSGSNTFSGGVTINAGILAANSAGALGTAAPINNATLNLTGASDINYTGLSTGLSGSGTNNVTLGTGAATVYLNGDYSAFTGVWNIGMSATANAAKAMMNGPDNPAVTLNLISNATLMCNGAATHSAAITLKGGDTGEIYGQLRIENNAVWAGPVTLAGDITTGVDGLLGSTSGTGTISGVISDLGGVPHPVTKMGGGTLALTTNNTYAGQTWIRAGTLAVNSIKSVNGGASGLGAPTTAASGTIRIGSNTTSAVLSYFGTGDTSDRVIDLAATTGGATLDHAGTGLLKFTSDLTASVAGNKQLSLTGASNNVGEISGAIVDNSASSTNSVYKDGFGVWTLSGNSTFKGGVTVNAGILKITKSGSLGMGVKAVRASNGTIGNPQLHLDGTDAPIVLGTNFTFYTSNQTDGSIHNLAGTNTIDGDISMTSGGGATIINSRAGKLTLSGKFTPDTTGRVLYLRGNGDGEISGIIRNGGSPNMPVLRDMGTGTWTLSNTNAFTGVATINSGTLALGGASGALAGGVLVYTGGTFVVNNSAVYNNTNRLNDAAAVTMSGGTFIFSHTAGSVNYGETAGTLVVNQGTNLLVTSQADIGYTSALTFASLTHSGNATINFSGTGLGANERNRVMIPALTPGLIGLWATVNGTDLAAYDAIQGVFPAPESVFTNIAAWGPSIIPNAPALNARITVQGVSGQIDLEGTQTNSIYTLQQNTGFSAVVGTAGKTLLTSDIQIGADQADLTIGASEGDGALASIAAGGELILANNSTNRLTVNAPIINNTSASSLSKTGPGTVKLTGANKYTGNTIISQSDLIFGGSSTQTLVGVVSGLGSLVKEGTNRLTLAGANTHDGETVVRAGILFPLNNTAFGSTVSGTVISNGATLDLGAVGAANLYDFGDEIFTVGGAGINGKGAIINSTTNSQYGYLNKVILTGNTTFGGNQSAARWDIRKNRAVNAASLIMNDFNITKTGSNTVGLTSAAVTPGAGNIEVQQGTLTLETSTTLGGGYANTMTVQNGARMDLYSLPATPLWSLVLNSGATLYGRQGTLVQNNWGGPVNISGTTFMDVNSGSYLTVSGDISGSGSLVKVGAATNILSSQNNAYGGSTIVSNGTLFTYYAGSLPGYSTTGKVTVVSGSALFVRTGDGTTGWNSSQIDALRTNATFTSNTAVLGIDTTLGDLTYASDIKQALSLTKQGTNTLTLTGVNTYSGTTRVIGGTLTLASTSTNGIGPIIVGGATPGATLNANGMVTLGTNTSQTVTVGAASGDRSVATFSTNAVIGKLLIGNASGASGSVIQNNCALSAGPTTYSTDVLSVGNGGYGYYRMNSGSLTTGQFAIPGSGGGSGVFDFYAGTINVLGVAAKGGWLIWGWANSSGVLNMFGGSLTSPAFNDTTMAYTSGSGTYGMLNMLGPNALLNTTANTANRAINMALSGGCILSVINLNSGTILANKVFATSSGTPTVFNFGGGTLKANTPSTTFLQGLTAATVYPGGAVIDSDTNAITINQPLQAPAGYGLISVPLTGGGAGYIGAPTVVITGGGGTGATAIATVDLNPASPTSGTVTGFTVTSAGTGYLPSDTLTVALNGGGFITKAVTGTCVLGPNTANGGLTKQGTGILTLGGTNTYGGSTTISSGTLKLGNPLALPTGTQVTLASGTLDLNGFTVTNTFSGNGTVSNGTVVTVISPAGANVLGTYSLGLKTATVQGNYFADVTADGLSDLVSIQGNVDLSGLALQIVDTAQLDHAKSYTILTCTGTLTGTFTSNNLPNSRWHVIYQSDGTVKLVYVDGTVLIFR